MAVREPTTDELRQVIRLQEARLALADEMAKAIEAYRHHEPDSIEWMFTALNDYLAAKEKDETEGGG